MILVISAISIFLAGVSEQASDLGVRTVTAHWPCNGHREHTSLCRLQQTEYYTRRESQIHLQPRLHTNPSDHRSYHTVNIGFNPQLNVKINVDKINQTDGEIESTAF